MATQAAVISAVGVMELNRNPDNYLAGIEQVAAPLQ